MGLFDQFRNISPEQNEGLLAAAAQMLQRSGDPTRPFGLGQALGVGLAASRNSMHEAERRKMEEAQARQMAAAREQQMQMGQLELAQKQRGEQEEIDMQGAYREGGADPQKLIDAVSRINPIKGMQLRQQLTPKPVKYDQTPRVGVDETGKPFTYVLGEDGSQKRLDGTLPRDELKLANLGGKEVAYNPFGLQPGQTFQRTQTPDSIASQASAAASRAQAERHFQARAAAASNGEGLLPDETVSMMAEQYRAGDTSVMQNLGRGAQGAQNIIRLRNEIARQAKGEGQGGRDLAAQNAEYFGTKAGQRTAGTRIANVEMASTEAAVLIPLAREASADVQRSGFLPFGKAQIMFNDQTNDPALRKFAAANNSLINVYARAISPSGTPTVSDKEHAREMLSTAMDQKSYNAVLDQMNLEISAARTAPKAVRQAFNSEVTGRPDAHQTAPQATGRVRKYNPLTGKIE